MPRRYGTGSTYEDKARGRWVAQVVVDGHRRRVYATTRPLAEKEARRLLSEADRGAPVAPAGTTGEWLQTWLDDILPGKVAASTEAQYRQAVKDWVSPYVGRVPLTKLGPEHVLRMMRDLEAKGLSPTTVGMARKVLRRALREAERFGKVSRNVAGLVDPPREAGAPKLDDTMTAEEAARVLDAARGDRLEGLAALVLAVGVRLGEAMGLRWSDLDLDGARVIVHGTKSEASDRVVALPTFVVQAFRRQRKLQIEERLASDVWADPDLVFASTVGTGLDRWRVRDWWNGLCDRAGVSRRRFHSSRHTAATLMLNKGVPLAVVSKTLGHAGLAITADVYAKVRPELQRTAADAMDELLAPKEG